MDNIKLQHRDTIFRWLFKEPHNFLQLLEWCRGRKSNLTVEEIESFDLDSELAYRIRRNDVSFITNDNRMIILIEHQSTICPNMAFRLFLYYVELVQLWIKQNEINMYGESEIPDIPAPEFYVAYNGTKPLKSEYSTFALEYEGIKIDVKVKIVDIRYEVMEDTSTTSNLAGYAFFYKVYDAGISKGLSREAAFTIARDECIKRGYLHEYVDKEDFIVFYKDFLDYDTQLKMEGRAEGKAEGVAIGLDKLAELIKNGFSLDEAMRKVKEDASLLTKSYVKA